jgi:hypothetical protein
MAGDIKLKYAASVALTVTNLHSLASSATWEAGWTSALINNTSDLYLDRLVSGTFTTHASNRQAGVINVWAYAALNDTPTWPDIFSSGTEGSEGTATVTDTEERDAAMRLVASIIVDNTASAVYTFPPTSLATLFGGVMSPYVALFVAQNASTTTTAGLAAAGSAIYHTPVLAQYT